MKQHFFILLATFLFAQLSAQEINYDKYGVDEDSHIPTGLKIGEKAPNFEGIDQNGDSVSLKGLINNQKVVLIFYRGVWCPVCVRYLNNLQDSLSHIEATGAAVIAVSPEIMDKVNETVKKTNAGFRIISDSSEKIMRDYDVWFKVTSFYEKKVNVGRLGDIAKNNGKDEARLPVPATFVIDEDGEIAYKHFDINYKSRASVRDILEAIKE